MLWAPAGHAQELWAAVPESVGMSTERLGRLRDTFTEYVEDGQLVGAVALVARHGKIAFLEAFGDRDREAGAPQRTGDIFRIASQSKAIVSVAIMMLQEEGELVISHPVSRYLPEFAETTVAVPNEDGGYEVVPAKRPITIRDLLTHTSGLSYGYGPATELWQQAGLFGWYFADRDEPIRETVRRMAALPFDVQPGEAFVYGYSVDVLGAVVEVVSGQPLDRFLHERPRASS